MRYKTLSELVADHQDDVGDYRSTGEMSYSLYYSLFDWYTGSGQIPYEVAKARAMIDPQTWVAMAFNRDYPAH